MQPAEAHPQLHRHRGELQVVVVVVAEGGDIAVAQRAYILIVQALDEAEADQRHRHPQRGAKVLPHVPGGAIGLLGPQRSAEASDTEHKGKERAKGYKHSVIYN